MREKGRGFALYRTANGLGLMLGPMIGGIVGSINLTYPFFLGGLLSLLAIPPVLLIPEGGSHGGEGENFLASLRGLVLTRKVVLICLATFMVELAFASLDLIIPLFGSVQGFSLASIGVILSSYFIAFTIFQTPIGIISEKISRKVLIAFCALAGAVPFILICWFHDVVTMSLAMGILGITLGTVFV
jgi:MFS family permease